MSFLQLLSLHQNYQHPHHIRDTQGSTRNLPGKKISHPTRCHPGDLPQLSKTAGRALKSWGRALRNCRRVSEGQEGGAPGGEGAEGGEALLCYLQVKKEKMGNIIGFQFEIFPFFRIIFVVFMERSKKKTEWTSEETELLTQLYSQFSSKKWKKISEELKRKGFNRSEIECREKWINFLDPSFNKQDWEPNELRRLYDLHEEVGTRWCLIQKEINRTQNKIKNRFYGTLRNYIRFVLGYFDTTRTCYNYEISKLSPKFLNDLYTSQNSFSFMAGETREAIYDMSFIVDKKLMGERVRKNKSLYSRMHQVILEAFEKKQNHCESRSEHSQSRTQHVLEGQADNQIQIKREETTVSGCPNQPLTPNPIWEAQRSYMAQMTSFVPFPTLNPGYFYWYI